MKNNTGHSFHSSGNRGDATAHFKLNTFLMSGEEAYHVARTTITSKDDLVYHNHNYAEIFWIKEGRGIHIINDRETELTTGTLVMIRPEDSHTFRLSANHESLVITNIAFRADNLEYFRQRYFENSETYFWKKDEVPFTYTLSSQQLNEISAIVDRLISQPRDYLHLDYLIINIFRIITSEMTVNEHIPHWLSFALENYNSPAQFKSGLQGFVNLSGRSVDHVNKSLNRYLKQTLTETVNRAKLEYAAKQLTLTNAAIKRISSDCGFENISYFHRIFKKYYGITPRDYRRKNHMIF